MIDVSMDKRVMPALKIPESQIRKLDITDTERIERFRTAGYGGNVSDALWALGICNTVLSQQFKALRQGMVLVGRALPVKLHTVVIDSSLGPGGESSSYVEDKLNGTEHPQKRMMRCVAESEPGSILCFDCGGDMQPAHFGEVSCQLAYSHGCRGMLIAGNCRDTQYVLKMPDFPMFSFGTAPNAFGGWIVTDVNVPIMLPGHLTYYVQVFPGDYVFADNDGAQIIPKEVIDEVLLRVEEIHTKENEQRKALADGMDIDRVYSEFGVL